MKKHNINFIAAWARDHGIKGFEHLDPKNREKHRMDTMRKLQEKKNKQERFRSSAG